jgi:hypothetical protein
VFRNLGHDGFDRPATRHEAASLLQVLAAGWNCSILQNARFTGGRFLAVISESSRYRTSNCGQNTADIHPLG